MYGYNIISKSKYLSNSVVYCKITIYFYIILANLIRNGLKHVLIRYNHLIQFFNKVEEEIYLIIKTKYHNKFFKFLLNY